MSDVQDPFTLVDSPWGRVEAWKANALAIGALSALYNKIRNDCVNAGNGGEPDPEVGELSAAMLGGARQMLDAIEHLEARMDRLECDQRERIRMDEEAEEASRLKLDPGDAPDDDIAIAGGGPHTGGELMIKPPVNGEPPGEEEDISSKEEYQWLRLELWVCCGSSSWTILRSTPSSRRF